MSVHITYDHSNLSILNLHASGIRSTRELEEVIESRISYCSFNRLSDDLPVYFFFGLSKGCKGIKILLMVDDSGKYITLDAVTPQPEKLLLLMCKNRRF